jgi:hypothetical protein
VGKKESQLTRTAVSGASFTHGTHGLRFTLKETQCSRDFLIGGVYSAMNGSEVLKAESWPILAKNAYKKKLADPRKE